MFFYCQSVSNNEFDSNAGLYYLTEAKLLLQNQNNTIQHHSHIIHEQSNLNTSELQNFKHKPRNNHGVHYQSLFYKDSSYETTKLGTLNDQINLKLDLTIKRKNVKALNKNENIQTNKRKINDHEDAEENLNVSSDSSHVNKIKDESDLTISEEDTTGDDAEEDDEMPFEEVGQKYLSRHSNIRRHTIGTGAENIITATSSNNNIIKSTEFSYMMNENHQSPCGYDEQEENEEDDEEEQPQQKRCTLAPNSPLANNKSILKEKKANSNKYLSAPNWSPNSVYHPQKKVQYHLSNGNSSNDNHHHNSHHTYHSHHHHHPTKHLKQHHLSYHCQKQQRNKNR